MPITILDIQRFKDHGQHFPMLTAYDYTSAQIADRAGIPIILVGDTLGMVVLGHPTTIPVTLDEMIHHTKAVSRGVVEALVVGDMPFLTYTTPDETVRTAGRFLQEGGAHAVKLEGGSQVVPVVRRLVELGIPVMGHIGMTPQSVNQLGGMGRVQGKRADQAKRLIDDALALEEAGVFSLVLELVPIQLAQQITERLRIPTIGIGAGPYCDGQVQVWHDLLGLYTDFVPKHAKHYARLADTIIAALEQFAQEVREGNFPSSAHATEMKAQELELVRKQTGS